MDAGPHGRLTLVDTEDGSRTLFHPAYEQTLHSSHGAVTEARWVFLDASGVADRLAAGSPTRVLEVGFGTGLNFLVTADQACRHAAELRYTALERALPPKSLVRELDYARHLDRPDLARKLEEALADANAAPHMDPSRVATSAPPPGRRRVFVEACPGVSLDLRLGEATEADLEPATYHAAYHDAFSPDANPELWTEAFLARLAASLAPGGVLTTYTVKGTVRRSLAALGLEVEKRKGPPGGKREMSWARVPVRARE